MTTETKEVTLTNVTYGTGFQGTFGLGSVIVEASPVGGLKPSTKTYPFFYWMDPHTEDVHVAPLTVDGGDTDVEDAIDAWEGYNYPTFEVLEAIKTYVVGKAKEVDIDGFGFGKVKFIPAITPDDLIATFGYPFTPAWLTEAIAGPEDAEDADAGESDESDGDDE